MKHLRLLLLSLLLAVAGTLSAQPQAILPSGLHDIMCNVVVNAGFDPKEDLAIIDFQTKSSYSYGTVISTSGNYSIYAAYNYPKQTLTFYTRADEFVAPESCYKLFADFSS